MSINSFLAQCHQNPFWACLLMSCLCGSIQSLPSLGLLDVQFLDSSIIVATIAFFPHWQSGTHQFRFSSHSCALPRGLLLHVNIQSLISTYSFVVLSMLDVYLVLWKLHGLLPIMICRFNFKVVIILPEAVSHYPAISSIRSCCQSSSCQQSCLGMRLLERSGTGPAAESGALWLQ
jgi:hypothetical protein